MDESKLNKYDGLVYVKEVQENVVQYLRKMTPEILAAEQKRTGSAAPHEYAHCYHFKIAAQCRADLAHYKSNLYVMMAKGPRYPNYGDYPYSIEKVEDGIWGLTAI
jgi:hypothetical protein